MKKIYALAAVAFMALAANAQNGAPLYITGQGDFVNGTWNAETPDEFAFEDGVYKISVPNLSAFTISTACGSWDALQAEGCPRTCVYGDEPGVEKELVDGKDNILTPWQGDWDIVVSADLKTISMTTETPQPPMEVFLRGDMNGWGSPAEWMMTASNNNQVFNFVCSGDLCIKAGETFKVADAGWAKINYGGDGEALLLDVETDIYYNASANLSVEEEWDGACWVLITSEVKQIYLSNDKDAEMPASWEEILNSAVNNINVENNGVAKYFNLQGVQVANPENGLYIVVKDGKSQKVLVK